MAEVRERRRATKAPEPLTQQEDTSKSKSKPRAAPEPDLEPNIWVVSIMFILFTSVVGTFLYYKVDNRENGPFSTWVNTNFPAVEKALNRPLPTNFNFLPGANAQGTGTTELKLTEEELKAYDGTDPDKPIYLGIDGKIFDVSASPAFYGPGGHYNHFVGKDATRAWITECWDEDEQFTWRMDDVEIMFTPKWFDEQVADAADNKFEPGLDDLKSMPKDMREEMAKKIMDRFGTITDGEKARRRKEDKEEASKKVQETLEHWVGFFSKNPKYKLVGSVLRDESRPAPPVPCAEALKKRPLKGGKLDSLMNSMGNLGQMGGGAKAKEGGDADPEPGKGEMPAWVKEQLAKKKAGKETGPVEEVVLGGDDDDDDEAEIVHEEL